MGTDKRERQKANRQQKLEDMAREARRRQTRRRALQIGIGIPLMIALVFGLVRLLSDEDSTATSPNADVTTTSGVAGQPLACPATDGSSAPVTSFPAAPTMCIDPAKTYTVVVDTSKGSYTAVLDAVKAPLTVNNFVFLARYHYFDNTPCHRIVPAFVVQCGDPTGTGNGNPGYSFADELPAAGEYQIGSLAMANSGANTNGSQFFVISGPQGVALPPNYSLFGQVTEGLDTITALDAVGAPDPNPPTEAVSINSVTVTES